MVAAELLSPSSPHRQPRSSIVAAMSPAVTLALSLVFACGASASNQDKAGSSPTASSEERIAAPSDQGAGEGAQQAAGIDDPRFHLQPQEGTITIGKAEAKAGA